MRLEFLFLILWFQFWGSVAINLTNRDICQTLGGIYRNSSDSCFWLGTVGKTWHDSFDYCVLESIIPYENYTGRPAQIDTEKLWMDIKSTYPNQNIWMGAYSLGPDPQNNNSNWKWMLTADNPNGAHGVTYLPPSLQLSNIQYTCMNAYTGTSFRNNHKCYAQLYPLCEFIPDTCKTENIDCGSIKECVSDSPNTHQCICPFGTTGSNCENIDLKGKCELMGGMYQPSTERCFWIPKVAMTWQSGFSYCASNDVVPYANYTGRLARIDSEQVWKDITTTTYPATYFWIGAHALGPHQPNNLSNWKWMLKADNPSGAHDMTYFPLPLELNRRAYLCASGYKTTSTFRNNYKCDQPFYPLCEFLPDTCKTENIDCGLTKTCVSDTPNTYQCICPFGKSGPNCENSDYMAVKCHFMGGVYERSSGSCFWVGPTKMAWHDSFAYCASADVVPYADYTGRLGHIYTESVLKDVTSTIFPDDYFWTGFRALGISPHNNMSNWKWMLMADNPDGAHDMVYVPPLPKMDWTGQLCGHVNYQIFASGHPCEGAMRPLCEFIPDTCKTQNIDCGFGKMCVSDSSNTHQCICPLGKYGTNCENTDYLAAKCQFMGGVYKSSSKSCFWRSPVKRTWHDSFAYCASNDIVPYANYTGRLARIDDEKLWMDIASITYGRSTLWTGMRALGSANPEKNMSNWKWMLVPDNPNGAHNFTYIPSSLQIYKLGHECATSVPPQFKNNYKAYCYYWYYPLCQFIPDTCKTQSIDCGSEKTCVSDSPNTYQCICPSGTSGANCEHFSYKDQCELMGGLYQSSSSSCFWLGTATKTWKNGFTYCSSNDVVPFPNYTGRLAHIDNEQMWLGIKRLVSIYKEFWLGHRWVGPNQYKNISSWKWMLTGDNANGAHDTIYEPPTLEYNWQSLCASAYYTTTSFRNNHLCESEIVPLCEFIPDTCKMQNITCDSPKICVSDTPNTYQCICPFGTSGHNCENIDKVASQCQLMGGVYKASSKSCFLIGNTAKMWSDSFDYCSSPEKVPIDKYIGRLAHIDTEEIWNEIISKRQGHFWAGYHAFGIDPDKNLTLWKWMLAADNPNGAKQLTFMPEPFNYIHKGTTCGSIYNNIFKFHPCTSLLIPLCEFLPDTCQTENITCGIDKTCVSDTPNTHQCICPFGQTGVNCDISTIEADSCHLIGGIYRSSSSSCFHSATGVTKRWQTAFDYCSAHDVVPIANYTGRPAHIDTQELLNDITAAYFTRFRTGHHYKGNGSLTDVSYWKWMLKHDNPNGAKDTGLWPVGSFGYAGSDVRKGCGEWYDSKFSNYYTCETDIGLMCEFIADTCVLNNVDCGPNKICVSDSNNSHICICRPDYKGTNCDQQDLDQAPLFFNTAVRFPKSNFSDSACTTMGGLSRDDRCFFRPPTLLTWQDSFTYCASKDFVPFFNYTGRLAHIDSAVLLSDLSALYPTNRFHIAHRALGPNPYTSISSWKWMLTPNNPNGARDNYFEPSLFPYTTVGRTCGYGYSGKFYNDVHGSCPAKLYPMCEFIPDVCTSGNIDCGTEKICVSDTPNTHQCICPFGRSGANCEISNLAAERCHMMGGVYRASSESCFWLGSGVRSWHDSFTYCVSYANSIPNNFGSSYVGRLAHIEDAQIWSDITAMYPGAKFYLAHYAFGLDPQKNESGWKWMLTADNPNGAGNTTFVPAGSFPYTSPGLYCGSGYNGVFQNIYGCESKSLNPMCEFIPDICTTQNINCGTEKTCVSDSPKIHKCICPVGKSGSNCEISQPAANPCQLMGGVYRASSESCFWLAKDKRLWVDSFEYCRTKARSLSNSFGSSYTGRLAHIDTEELWGDITIQYPYTRFHIGHRALGASPYSDIFSWKWMLTADNPKGAHNTSFTTAFSYVTRFSLCGYGYSGWFSNDKYGSCPIKLKPLCEFIPDICTTQNINCGSNKICVSDSPKTYQCICPSGKSGNNCEISSLAAESCQLMSGVYKESSESCYWIGPQLKTWHDGFDYCASKAKVLANSFGGIYTGRLAHIYDQQVWSEISAKYWPLSYYIGHRALGPSPHWNVNMSSWKWMLTPDNTNGARDTTFEPTAFTYTQLPSHTQQRQCAYGHQGQFKSYECEAALHNLCEFIPDICTMQNIDCGSEKICVSDSPKTYQCICPFGKSGDNCEIYNLAAESCRFMGGLYIESSKSCFWLGNVGKTWHDSFGYCASKAPNNFGTNYTGRLAHVTNEQLWNDITAKFAHVRFHIGHRAIGPGSRANMSGWKWMMTPDNPNGAYNGTYVKPVSLLYVVSETSCGYGYNGNFHNDDYYGGCEAKLKPLCEFIPDVCTIEDINCGVGKICVSDSPLTYQCICPGGKSGNNCEISDSHHQTCQLMGGVYRLSSESCFWPADITKTWHDSFGYCASKIEASPNYFGQNYTGRLAHIDTEQLWNDIATKYWGLRFHIGHHALGPNPNTDMSSWKWMLTPDNPNGARNNSFEPDSFSYSETSIACGFGFNGMFQNDINGGCGKLLKPLCEFMSDTCQVKNVDCGPMKKCVSTSYNTYQCICPNGLSGNNCDEYNVAPLCHMYGLFANESVSNVSCFSTITSTSEQTWNWFDSQCRNKVSSAFQTRLIHVTSVSRQRYAQTLMSNENQSFAAIGIKCNPENCTLDDGQTVLNYLPDNIVFGIGTTPLCTRMSRDDDSWESNFSCNSPIANASICEHFVPTICDYVSNRHGSCNPIFPGTSYTWICDQGWLSINCADQSICLIEAPCLHNGACVGGIYEYQCICTSEWSGLNCTDPNICVTESPCQNNGTCIDGPNEDYTCNCEPTWSGSNCTDPNICIIEEPCGDGGTCTDGPGNAYTCNCIAGRIGVNCTFFGCNAITPFSYGNVTHYSTLANGSYYLVGTVATIVCNSTNMSYNSTCHLRTLWLPNPVTLCKPDETATAFRVVAKKRRPIDDLSLLHDFQSGVVSNWASCGYSCTTTPGCVSFGYSKQLKHCQMYQTFAKDMNLIDDTDYEVFERADIEMYF